MWILCINKWLKNRWKWNNYWSRLFTWTLTALMPLSCWPIVITMTVMSCHLTARSVNNCQGFLGFSPPKAKHSLWMSSISLRYSEEPWNRFKATNTKKEFMLPIIHNSWKIISFHNDLAFARIWKICFVTCSFLAAFTTFFAVVDLENSVPFLCFFLEEYLTLKYSSGKIFCIWASDLQIVFSLKYTLTSLRSFA